MPGLNIITTTAGRAALVNAAHNGTAPLTITEIGLTAAVFTPSADMTALPEEFKRLATISGEVVAADTIHVTIRDDSAEIYTVRGVGYWLSNGVLLGVYSQPDPILEKSAQSMMLLSADTVFTTVDVAGLTFGNANFTNPPATIERQGVVELATAAETVTGADATRAVTPAGLRPALAHTIAAHKAEADPHGQYLTPERANKLYFHTLVAYTNSDTDCDTLLETGVREVSVTNDRGILAHTHLPAGCEGYGTLTTLAGNVFVRQVYSDGGLAQRTWERTGYLNETPPFKSRPWKLAWDTTTFDPAAKQNALGFTPVQQGTGIGQNPNIVKIGWSKDTLKATVDATDLGDFVFQKALEAALAQYLALTAKNLTQRLTLFAELSGPAFTAIPTAPTPSPFNNSKQLANTEYVQSMAGFRNVRVFNHSGNFTVPAGVTAIFAQCWGAGGGGGRGRETGTSGGGGGAGGYGKGFFNAIPAQHFVVTIGEGGQGQVEHGQFAGGAGGTSSFGAFLSCTGGFGGANYEAGAGGGGSGQPSGNNAGGWSGACGGPGIYDGSRAASGGNGGGPAGGAGGAGNGTGNHGANASTGGMGSGGGGGGTSPGAGGTGMAGGAGMVVIYW